MTHNIDILTTWIRIVAIVTAVCTTSVPMLYSVFPWRTRRFGQIFMLQAIAFAVAMDMTVLFSYWHPKDILIIFWVDAVVLSVVAASTAAFAILIGYQIWKSRKVYK